MFRDVRMRGFRERAPVQAAQAWIDALALAPRSETVPLREATGRLLSQDLIATCDVPAFARAAMDGWALQARNTFGAGRQDPIPFEFVGTSLAGRPYVGRLLPGQAIRIMTGAAMPMGADAVLPAEEGTEEGGRVHALQALVPGRHVNEIGEDVRKGTRVLPAGRRLRPQDVGLAAALGHDALSVRVRPRVGILVTGDEITRPGSPVGEACIADVNGPMLSSLVERDGAQAAELVYVPDRRADLARALTDTPGDILLVSGGSSVGQEDHAPSLLAELGSVAFHGLALRPAAPAGMGQIGTRPVFLQPGHPVSCLCAYDLLAGRWVRRFAWGTPHWPYEELRAPLLRKISSPLGRLDYVRVRLTPQGIEPVMSRGAAILSSTTESDGFVLIRPESEGHASGEIVTVYGYDRRGAPQST